MSQSHVFRLKKVKNEFDTSSAAVAYTAHYWHYQDKPIVPSDPRLLLLRDMTLKEFEAALSPGTLESIFIIRLFAVFEGVLKDHHSLCHANDTVSPYASVSWYIDRIAFFNRERISDKLVENVHEVRKYRNSLVHSLPNGNAIVFTEALADLSKFAAKLPEI